jgi:predicted N-acetyltransferase YhbS
LLQWAEDWLCEHSRTIARLGGGLRPFAPGVPRALNVNFFRAHGYVPREENYIVQDFGNDLQAYASPLFLRTLNAVCRPAEKTDIDALRTFYAREFPGRWQYEFEQHLHDGARIQDYFILSSERGIDACCQVTLEDSLRPVERYYPSPLPRLWGQVGAIGVSADRRNAGYGSTLLDAALQHLRERGVRGCIIDWTHHIGYYERFGFKPHRAYEVLVKKIRD